MSPIVQALDHLICFLPIESTTKLPDCPQVFKDNFTLTPGGFHADGATSNTLILFADGSYIELISFVNPDLAQAHWWGPDAGYLGWKDWCLTNEHGPGENHKRISETHDEPIAGGRTRADGVSIEWAVTFPKGPQGGQRSRGRIPFFCHDITARAIRVPMNRQNTCHSSGALGILQISVIVRDEALLNETKGVYSSIFGGEQKDEMGEAVFQAGRVYGIESLSDGPKITLRLPNCREEMEQTERSGFVYGNVVLGAKSDTERPPGFKVRVDSACKNVGVGGLWIEYI